jgi:FAD/FMN-containing dehydrogenase
MTREIMADLRVITLTGEETVLKEPAVEAFKASLRGPLLRPGDVGYDDARKVWNGMIDRRPALIVRCAGVADVIHGVNFARTHNFLVSVKGGAHNIPGNAVCHGGLTLDLSRLRSVVVDPGRRMARAEPGATWADFDHETQAFGLATTGGTAFDTGIAGLTLGGGLGWLAGKYGLTCDNLLAVDTVTADGQLRTASATENPELFWAVRGGGGNFGVVTAFQYQLHPVGLVLAGQVFYPFEQAKAFLTFYRDFSRDIPDELNTIGGLATLPDVGPVAAAMVCYNGPVTEGEKVLRPLREFGAPLRDAIRPMPYTEIQRLTGPMLQAGRRNYIKSIMVQDIGEAVIDTLVAYFARVPSPCTLLVFQQLGNAANRAGKDATAFNHRDADYELIMHAIWLDPGDDEQNRRWTRELAATILPLTGGSDYINQMGTEAEEGADRIRAAFGPNYQRLVAVKQKYDPTNLFRHNQNIKPAG